MTVNKEKLSSRQDVVRRLKIVAGHVNKIIKMVEDDVYCIDIMQQTAAVRSAVKKAEEVLLASHLNGCVARAIQNSGQEKVRAIDELTQIFKKID